MYAEDANLTRVGSKLLYTVQIGQGSDTIVFVHGLGGTHEHFRAVSAGPLAESHRLLFYDLDGHGLSPIDALTSDVSIESFSDDLQNIFQHYGISRAKVVAHSVGCLIAILFATKQPEAVSKLVLLGPLPFPVPEPARESMRQRAKLVRTNGMGSIVEAVVAASVSEKTKTSNPLVASLVRMSLLATSPAGYTQACMAIANSSSASLNVDKIQAKTLIITGTGDQVCPPAVAEKWANAIKDSQVHVLEDVAHQHAWEDTARIAELVEAFLSEGKAEA